MATPARKAITIQYRRLEDVTGAFGGQTLEATIRKAMAHIHDGGAIKDHWKRRVWVVSPEDQEILFSNLHSDGGTYYYGDITQYSRGFMQALIEEKDDSPMLSIEQHEAPDGQQYVNSIMHWMVIGNHVLIVQSASLTTKTVERYFTWLLKDRAETIAPTGQVLLQALFDIQDVGGDLEDITEIIVGGASTELPIEIASSVEPQKNRDEISYKSIAQERSWASKAKAILNAIMSSESDVEELLRSVPDEASLEVSVHIGYKSKKRSVTKAPMQHALRNLPEGEITAKGKGGRLTGSDIRLNYPARILKLGSILDPDDTKRALLEAYEYFVNNGKIE